MDADIYFLGGGGFEVLAENTNQQELPTAVEMCEDFDQQVFQF